MKNRRMWKSIKIWKIGVGALGTVCKLEEELVKLSNEHRQERDPKSAIIFDVAGISENIIKESFGSPWLVVLTRDLNKLNPANNIMLCALSIII